MTRKLRTYIGDCEKRHIKNRAKYDGLALYNEDTIFFKIDNEDIQYEKNMVGL